MDATAMCQVGDKVEERTAATLVCEYYMYNVHTCTHSTVLYYCTERERDHLLQMEMRVMR
jgi:hypothetical protein